MLTIWSTGLLTNIDRKSEQLEKEIGEAACTPHNKQMQQRQISGKLQEMSAQPLQTAIECPVCWVGLTVEDREPTEQVGIVL